MVLTKHTKQGSNPIVVRWNLALQELDFTLEFVKVVENTIAGAMSRLFINNTPTKLETAIMSAIQGTYILSEESFRLIEQCHNIFNGHGGVKRTMHKLHLLK
jgi:hypothetical protein